MLQVWHEYHADISGLPKITSNKIIAKKTLHLLHLAHTTMPNVILIILPQKNAYPESCPLTAAF